MSEVLLDDLFIAAVLRALGATTVGYEAGPEGRGAVRLDVRGVTPHRLAMEADVLAAQLREMPACPDAATAERLVKNTFLGPMAEHLGTMRKVVRDQKTNPRPTRSPR